MYHLAFFLIQKKIFIDPFPELSTFLLQLLAIFYSFHVVMKKISLLEGFFHPTAP